MFDHDRMLQVFANLLSNSIKFTSGKGAINVRVDRTGSMLRFRISDTGVGIAAPMLEAVFERFWQVGKDDRRGMGLGLYISRCIVESHGGRIWAESKVGKGSEFYFTLPVTSKRPRRSTARSAAPEKTPAMRVGKTRALRPRRR
jgi:signal transduction histidine kinase